MIDSLNQIMLTLLLLRLSTLIAPGAFPPGFQPPPPGFGRGM